MRTKIYALMIGIPEQKEIISKVCFGFCGKVIVGGIDIGEYGPAVPCKRPASECPAFDKEMDVPSGEVDGCDVFLRKLKQIDKKGNRVLDGREHNDKPF